MVIADIVGALVAHDVEVIVVGGMAQRPDALERRKPRS